MKEVSMYLANQLGFSETGRYVLEALIKPRIKKIGKINIIDPFKECGKELDFSKLESIKDYDERVAFWKEFSLKVTPINNKSMENSDCLGAILDGGHQVDEGVAGEIGYYAALKKGPIFALRSDFRGGENVAVSINPQLLGYILMSGGELVDDPNALERWFEAIKEWYDNLK